MKATVVQNNIPLLVLDLSLDIVDGVGRLHLKGDRLPREGLDENLHFWRSMSMSSSTERRLTLRMAESETIMSATVQLRLARHDCPFRSSSLV